MRGKPLNPLPPKLGLDKLAIYHLSTNPISRKSGRSSVASSAYRSGTKLEDKRTGKVHDYTKKNGIVASDCFVFKDNEKIKLDRNQVWNTAEQMEKRKDSRTAREIVINLPHELDKEQRSKLVADFAESVAKKYNVAVDYAIHLPDKHGDQRNHHSHILMTTRTAELDKNNNIVLGDKTAIELGNKDLKKLGLPSSQEQIKDLRAEWANMANHHLEMAGLEERIDHRSHAERGLETLPTVKLGWEASELERQGIATDRGNYNRQIHQTNEQIAGLNLDIRFMKVEHELENLSKEPQETMLQAFENQSDTDIADSKENAIERTTDENRGGRGASGGGSHQDDIADKLENALNEFARLANDMNKDQIKPQAIKPPQWEHGR